MEKIKEEIMKAENERYKRRMGKIVEKLKKEKGSIDQVTFWEVQIKVDIRRIEEKSKSEWKKQIKIRIKEKVGNIARKKIKDQQS